MKVAVAGNGIDSHFVRRRTTFALFLLASISAACTVKSKPLSAADVEGDIERQIVAAHPEYHLQQFARFYAYEKDGSVRAIYLLADDGDDPIVGKAGTSRWTSLIELPVVADGGCSVLNVHYDASRKKLLSVQCNGRA